LLLLNKSKPIKIRKMRSVSIIETGMSKFGENWNLSFRDLIAQAGYNIINKEWKRNIDAIYIGCMASGSFISQEHLGALAVETLGLTALPSTRVEAACASGGVALRQAYLSIASGQHDLVVVLGVEKMTEISAHLASSTLGGASDQELELFHGATFPSLYALMAQMHMKEYGTTERQLAAVAVKNHKNASYNLFAQFNKEISINDVLNSSKVSSPLKLLDCSPITDGAAMVVLASSEFAKKITKNPIEILACEQASDTLSLAEREKITEMKATIIAAGKAYRKAGITAKEIDFAEVHDCFTIAEIMAIEDLGFFQKGEGGLAVESGKTSIEGLIPINPSGGLKAKGHPVGATGVAQAVEVFKQLNGLVEPERQVKNAKLALTHNIGGSGATAVISIYRRLE
jgi:acetyl-CoA C-acetyltransferase